MDSPFRLRRHAIVLEQKESVPTRIGNKVAIVGSFYIDACKTYDMLDKKPPVRG